MDGQGRTTMWLSSLYFAKGLPRVVVFVIALLLFRQMGFRVGEALCAVSLFYLPWVLKVWWKPLVDATLNYRHWILTTQLLILALNEMADVDTAGWFVLAHSHA